jgi:hypothetical protein
MSSQVRNNVANPHKILFHYYLIILLVIAKLEKQRKTCDEFIYQFSNPHITINTCKKTLDIGVVTPSKSHSQKTPKPPTQAIHLLEQKTKKLVDTPATSLGKKTKNPIDKSPIPSTPIELSPKMLQEAIQHISL